METLLHVISCIFRLEKDVAGVEHITLLLKDFDDVESVRSLHDL